MSIAINSTNFPDAALRNFVKNTMAGGGSVLTDDMLLPTTTTSLKGLGIKDITGLELLFPDVHLDSFIWIDLSYNNISDINVDELSAKMKNEVQLWFQPQNVSFPANEIIYTGNTDYPYQFNLGKYVSNPASRAQQLRYISSSVFLTDCIISGNILKLRENPREIYYALATSPSGARGGPRAPHGIYLEKNPYILSSNARNRTLTRGSSYNIQLEVSSATTLPVTWSISEGELPPGLSLNSSTGVISGTPT